jgi:hypothetical protein
MDGFIAMLSDKKGAADGLKGLQGLVDGGDLKAAIGCSDSIPAIVELAADKQKPVATAAADLAKAIFDKFPGWGARYALPQLKAALDMKSKPQVKEVALEIVEKFAKDHPECISHEIEWLVSPISFLMNDIKASVKTKAKAAMVAIVACSGNQDLANFGGTIVRAQESLKNVNDCRGTRWLHFRPEC